MHRRRFFAVLGAAITAARTPCAQQQAIPVIGYLGSTSPGPSAAVLAALRQGLGETGWVEGRNLTIEYRWMEGRSDRLPALVADLVGRNVDVIVAGGPLPALALKSASSTIPIVFNVGMDPVGAGLVASFAHPGGNLTGVSIMSRELMTSVTSSSIQPRS